MENLLKKYHQPFHKLWLLLQRIKWQIFLNLWSLFSLVHIYRISRILLPKQRPLKPKINNICSILTNNQLEIFCNHTIPLKPKWRSLYFNLNLLCNYQRMILWNHINWIKVNTQVEILIFLLLLLPIILIYLIILCIQIHI